MEKNHDLARLCHRETWNRDSLVMLVPLSGLIGAAGQRLRILNITMDTRAVSWLTASAALPAFIPTQSDGLIVEPRHGLTLSGFDNHPVLGKHQNDGGIIRWRRRWVPGHEVTSGLQDIPSGPLRRGVPACGLRLPVRAGRRRKSRSLPVNRLTGHRLASIGKPNTRACQCRTRQTRIAPAKTHGDTRTDSPLTQQRHGETRLLCTYSHVEHAVTEVGRRPLFG